MTPEILKQIQDALSEFVEFYRGGKSKGNTDGMDEAALSEGTKHELEHTASERIARKIAADHLAEHPDYYKRLKEAGL